MDLQYVTARIRMTHRIPYIIPQHSDGALRLHSIWCAASYCCSNELHSHVSGKAQMYSRINHSLHGQKDVLNKVSHKQRNEENRPFCQHNTFKESDAIPMLMFQSLIYSGDWNHIAMMNLCELRLTAGPDPETAVAMSMRFSSLTSIWSPIAARRKRACSVQAEGQSDEGAPCKLEWK